MPHGQQVFGRRLMVENLDLLARLFGSGSPRFHHWGKTELAWLAADDPAPFVAMGVRFAGDTLRKLLKAAFHGGWQANLQNPRKPAKS